MSQVKFAIFGAALLSGCNSVAPDQDKRGSAQSGTSDAFIWSSESLRQGVATTSSGPQGLLRLRCDGTEAIVVAGENSLKLDLEPPAQIYWAPDGKALALNNGKGSGQIAHPVVVALTDRLELLTEVENDLKRHFIAPSGCRIRPEDISVPIVGWRKNGSSVVAQFESWDRKRFCSTDAVYSAEYRPTDRQFISTLSRAQTLSTYCREVDYYEAYTRDCESAHLTPS